MNISIAEAREAMGGRPPESGVVPVGGQSLRRVVIDSRKVEAGDLFLAFPGEKTDGHLYVAEAFRKGAAACVVSRPVKEKSAGPLIQVDNVEQALLRLAAWYRSKIKVPVVAITGSSGKSTTKEITAQLLARHFQVLAAPESYNNEIGVPLTLLAFEPEHQAVVLEMAMRGPGQIHRLCEVARPSLGLITSIGEAHVGLLGSLRAIADAKGELLESLPGNGFAFLNSEDKLTPYLEKKSRCAVRTYGVLPGDWVSAKNIRETWEGTTFKLVTAVGDKEMVFPLLGQHNLLNFLGAAAIALTLGVPLSKIKQGAAQVKTLHGRLEPRKGKNGLIILDDSYNANPGSVLAALKTIRRLPTHGRRILVLGDMLELGEFGEKAHAKVGEEICSLEIDALFGLGELTESAVEEAQKRGVKFAKHFPDHASLLGDLRSFVKHDDVVLVKGSRKMAMEKVVESLEEKA